MTNYKISRGEIYMADLGVGLGSVQGGTRPVVIVSNSLNNKFSPTVNVLPITSQTKNSIPVHVNIGIESGLPKESTVLVEQILTVDKRKLTKQLGNCTREIMGKIAKAIILQTELTEYLDVI